VSDDADELRRRLGLVLRRMALCSDVPARLLVPAASHARPGSAAPQGERSRAEQYALEADRAGDDVRQLTAILRKADDELTTILRRPLAPTTTATLADLCTAIVDRGTGFSVDEVSVALRCSATIVRKARLASGRDVEWGRPLPDDVVNGQPLRFGLGLLEAGYSLRAASALSGIPRSTLHEHVARQTDATLAPNVSEAAPGAARSGLEAS
jgi:hypothetical protein